MDGELVGLSDGELLSRLDGILDVLTSPGRPRLEPDREQMATLARAVHVTGRLESWQAGLAGHLEKSEAVWNEHGTSTSTWLAGAVNLTRREAGRLIAAGQGLHRFPLVGAAAAAGAVLPGQAEAITSVLDKLPDEFPTETVCRAQELMVGFAADYTSTELRRLSEHLLEVLAPEVAEEVEAARVEREYRQACTDRYLTFTNDHHGSMLIRGSLPVVDAEPLVRIIDAYAAAAKRGDDVLDPARRPLSPRMRRADALVTMAARHTQDTLAPTHGGDRPRIVVTLDYDTLHAAAAAATGAVGDNPLCGHLAVPGTGFRPGCCGAGCATPTSSPSCWVARRRFSTWAVRSAWSPPPSGPPSTPETKDASSRAATSHPATVTPTTASRGGPAG